MHDVDLLLLDASANLKASLVAEMQLTDTPADLIEVVRGSTASLVIPWDRFLASYKTAVVAAAYQRYKEWYAVAKRSHPSLSATVVATSSSSQKKSRNDRRSQASSSTNGRTRSARLNNSSQSVTDNQAEEGDDG